MNKPTKPNITIPESFAANGVKADFDDDKILNGFDRIQPDVLAGDNLNKFIDDTYKGLNYGMAAADAINLINEGETLIVVDGQLRSGAIGAKIGQPIITLDNSLEENEIWLEGAEVSKANYPNLYAIYGDTYGAPSDTNNFILPDFRNRAIWGADGFGYLEAGLPNISFTIKEGLLNGATNGALTISQVSGTWGGNSWKKCTGVVDASVQNSIYGNSETVQPPAIKVRVKTKFE